MIMMKTRFWEIEQILDLYKDGNDIALIAKYTETPVEIVEWITQMESAKEYLDKAEDEEF